MGAIFSLCGLSQLACCCSSAACSAISCCAPTSSPKIMNVFILLLVTLSGWIMTLESVSTWLKSYVPFCWNSALPPKADSYVNKFGDSVTKLFNDLQNMSNVHLTNTVESPKNGTNVCDELTGYLAVYRLMFATTIFFAFFGVIMIKVKNSQDPRVTLHKGLWGIKFLLLIAGIVGAFFIPDSSTFSHVWQNFGFVGSFIFLFIQFLLVIVFADDVANSLVTKMEEDDDKCSRNTLILWSFANFIATFVAVVLFYVYYTGPSCGLHKFFISINFILVVILSILSILPKVQEYNSRSGLLQPSIISIYIIYITWSALSSSPYQDCKPVIWSNHTDASMNLQSFVSLLICFVFIVYSAIRLSSQSQINRLTGADSSHNDADDVEDEEERSSWCISYFTYCLATLYLMMTLTNWFSPNETYKRFGESNSSLWIKISSSWICALIYLWTLFAPMVLHEYRDFEV